MKYSDNDLLQIIETEETQSYSDTYGGTLQEQRDTALDYYLGEPYGNEVPDRSQVVTREVLETIEWVLPSLLKVFFSGDEVVVFEPRGPEDIEQAEQETEYINYVVQQKNDGFNIFYTWFKDALLSKTGYVKAYWEEKTDYQDERFEGLTEDELNYILSDREVEILEQEAYQDAFGTALFTVKLRQTVPCKQAKYVNVPPEEMRVSTKTREVSLKNSPFVEHISHQTISSLRDQGFDLDMSKMGSYGFEEDSERDIYDETNSWENDEAEESMRNVVVRDIWMRIDDDGDGIAELKHIMLAGTQVLVREDAEFIPIVAICPIPMPHRHIGLSYADLAMPSQLQKSTILRQILDNMYLSNNVRTAMDADRVNLDDMLVSRPGGIVRTKGDPAGALMPLVNPPIYSQAFGMLEYLDTTRENSTGVTKYNQGLDANSLNKTATGINAIMGASQQRLELVTRLFAEGVKELFGIIHALTAKHADSQDVMRLRNKYIAVDPRGWKRRTDLTISVGIGTGNKDQMLQHYMMLLNAQKEAKMGGLPIVTDKNIYNALAKLTQNAGLKDVDSYWTDPEGENSQPQQPQIPPELQKQIQEGMKKMQDQAQEIQKLQAEILKRDTDSSVKVYEVDKRSETELMKVQMQNESKESLAQFNAIAEAIMQTQSDMSSKISAIESTEPDYTPIMQAFEVLQQKIDAMQPVGIKQVRDESGRLIGGVRVLADGTEQEISIQ